MRSHPTSSGNKPFSWRDLQADSLVFLIIWLASFLLMRRFTHLCAAGDDWGLRDTLMCGVAHDVAAFCLIWPLWAVPQFFGQFSRLSRYFSLAILIPVFALGFLNALFVRWANEPLNHTFLTYLPDLPSLFASGSELMLPWYWMALSAMGLLAVALIAFEYGRRRRAPFSKPPRKRALIGWTLVAGATFISVSFEKRGAAAEHNAYGEAVAANVISYEAAFAARRALSRLDLSALKSGDQEETARVIELALVRDRGEFTFLDPEFPLMKHNASFSQPGQRLATFPAGLSSKPNVVFIFLESFRAKEIAAYGGPPEITPRFNELAGHGWLWENYYSNGVQTPHACWAALTSSYPHMGESVQRSRPTMALRGLPAILTENGYQAEYWHGGSLVFDRKIPFFRNLGFQRIVGEDEIDPQGRLRKFGWGIADAEFAKVIANRLNSQPAGDPLFMTAFTVSNHHPWITPDPALKIVPESGDDEYPKYENTMHYADYALGLFFDNLSEEARRNTIFFITADTAQPMGEHNGNTILIQNLFDENVRVPFLIYAPGFIKEPRRFSEIASHVDVMPTLLDILGIACDNAAVGRSLLASAETPIAYFCNPFFDRWAGVRRGDYKLIYDVEKNQSQLYDLRADPGETRDLAAAQPQLAEELEQTAVSHMNASQYLVEKERLWKK